MVLRGNTTLRRIKNSNSEMTPADEGFAAARADAAALARETATQDSTAAELLDQIETLAKKLKTVGDGAGACSSNRIHGETILLACRNVRDRITGKDA